VETQNAKAKPNRLLKWFRRRILKNFFSAFRWSGRALAWAWSAALAVLHFLNLIEDDVSPPRLSSTKVMIWGAMGVGTYLIGKLQFTGESLTVTETSVVAILTLAAGLMKFRRDQQDERDGRGRWGGYGGGYGGRSEVGDDDPIDPFADPE
jgi:hypothetical protein